MKCECKYCIVHVIVRILNCIAQRCKAVAKAIVGK